MKKKKSFVTESLSGVLSFVRSSVLAEEYALKNGFLQSFDPRVKLISFSLFFLTAILLRRIDLLAILYILCLILVFTSKISLGYFLKRTLVFIPIFSLFIAFPAIFSLFSPGEAVAVLKLPHFSLTITQQGLYSGGLFVVRVLVSVSYAVILSLTTRHTVLLRVLRVFKVPQIFILVLGMCYRYIYLFVEIIENTFLSIKSRCGGLMHYKKGQRVVGWNIAYLWQRSFVLSQQVYQAMLSRGYSGEPVLLEDFRTKARDWLLLSSTVIFLSAMIFINTRLA